MNEVTTRVRCFAFTFKTRDHPKKIGYDLRGKRDIHSNVCESKRFLYLAIFVFVDQNHRIHVKITHLSPIQVSPTLSLFG